MPRLYLIVLALAIASCSDPLGLPYNASDPNNPNYVPMPIGSALTVAVVGHAIRVRWSDQGGTGRTGYVVMRSYAADGPFEEVAELNRDATEFLDAPPELAAEIHYRVHTYVRRGGERHLGEPASGTVRPTWVVAPSPSLQFPAEGLAVVGFLNSAQEPGRFRLQVRRVDAQQNELRRLDVPLGARSVTDSVDVRPQVPVYYQVRLVGASGEGATPWVGSGPLMQGAAPPPVAPFTFDLVASGEDAMEFVARVVPPFGPPFQTEPRHLLLEAAPQGSQTFAPVGLFSGINQALSLQPPSLAQPHVYRVRSLYTASQNTLTLMPGLVYERAGALTPHPLPSANHKVLFTPSAQHACVPIQQGGQTSVIRFDDEGRSAMALALHLPSDELAAVSNDCAVYVVRRQHPSGVQFYVYRFDREAAVFSTTAMPPLRALFVEPDGSAVWFQHFQTRVLHRLDVATATLAPWGLARTHRYERGHRLDANRFALVANLGTRVAFDQFTFADAAPVSCISPTEAVVNILDSRDVRVSYRGGGIELYVLDAATCGRRIVQTGWFWIPNDRISLVPDNPDLLVAHIAPTPSYNVQPALLNYRAGTVHAAMTRSDDIELQVPGVFPNLNAVATMGTSVERLKVGRGWIRP